MNEAISKWISSGGRFLSKCSDCYCVLSDRAEQQPVAAYYFRNYRSMGLSRRSTSRAALLTSMSTLSLDKSPGSDKSPPDSHLVSPPSPTVPQMSPEVPRNLSIEATTVDVAALAGIVAAAVDDTAPAVDDTAVDDAVDDAAILPKRRSPRFRHLKSKAVGVSVQAKSAVPTISKPALRKKTTEQKRQCGMYSIS